MAKLQLRDGKLRLVNRQGLTGLPERKILAQDLPEFQSPDTDCCCGYDVPLLYVPLLRCKDGSRTGYYTFFNNADTLWFFPTMECVHTPWPVAAWEPLPPDGKLIGINDTANLGAVLNCDIPECTGERPPPPPNDWHPPPDPGPGPVDCGNCGTSAGVDPCVLCTCKPVSKVRVAVAGTANCACIGPCPATTYTYSRVSAGETIDGIVDMDPFGPCEWLGSKAVYLDTGQVGDPPGLNCRARDVFSVSYHLKKLTKNLYVFSVYVNPMSGYDPRDYDPADNSYNFRFFVGFATVQENTCMNIPTMQNFMACQCESSATSDGRFGLATGGQAVFDACAS